MYCMLAIRGDDLVIGLPPENPPPPSTPLSDTTIWILIAAFIVIVICGIIATFILAKSIKRRKEKEIRQRLEDKQKETWRDY